MIRETYWRLVWWLWLKREDFEYWREMQRRRKALRKWHSAQDWRRLK